MKTLTVKLYSGTDHYEEELGPPLPRPPVPAQCRKRRVPSPPYQCGACQQKFFDPDECMVHAVREHPREETDTSGSKAN